jgi:uncharacterized protein
MEIVMTETTTAEQHSVAQSLLLHLLPGLLITGGYFVLIRPLRQWGYPSLLALMVAIAVILVPFELGYLLYQGRRRNGRLSLEGIVLYRDRIRVWQYLLWVPVVLVAAGVIFTVLKPVDTFLQQRVFFAWPPLDSGLTGEYSRSALIVTYAMLGLFSVVIAPIVEELYFRGFLLPRMDYAGKWAPLLHSFLFALYHFFTPWMIVARTLGVLPVVYAARRRNIYVGMIVHVLVNSIDLITGIAFIAAMS